MGARDHKAAWYRARQIRDQAVTDPVGEIVQRGQELALRAACYEVAPVMSLSEHEANDNCIWVSDKAWNSFSDDEKKWVQEAADEVNRLEPTYGIELEHQSMAKLEKTGVKFAKEWLGRLGQGRWSEQANASAA